MIRLDMPQGSPEWIEARLGIPTASNFHRILSLRTRKLLDKGSETYQAELLAEWMLGSSLDPYVSEWMERGSEMEPQAVAYYELQREIETSAVGFIMRDDRLVGCSPDRLVGEDGGLEIKCPSPKQHVLNLLHAKETHYLQCQGGMWLSGRKWWDLMSFHQELPPAIVRYERDEDVIEDLATEVGRFIARMLEARETSIRRGFTRLPSGRSDQLVAP